MYAILDILTGEYLPVNSSNIWVWQTKECATAQITLRNHLAGIDKYELVELDSIKYNKTTWALVNG